MNRELPPPPSFWKTVELLLAASRKRAAGRKVRQRELLQERSGGKSRDWGEIGFLFTVLFMALLNGLAAWSVILVVDSGERAVVEHQGKVVVSVDFLVPLKEAAYLYTRGNAYLEPAYAVEARRTAAMYGGEEGAIEEQLRKEIREQGGSNFVKAVDPGERVKAELQGKIPASADFLETLYWARREYFDTADAKLNACYPREARHIAERYGGTAAKIEQHLRMEVHEHGAEGFVSEEVASPGLAELGYFGRLPQMLGSVALLWWAMMLVFQGEGVELDLQRRRHPMWEWLFAHPVRPGAVFLAEMLSPIAANPVYWSAPLFAGIVYRLVYGPQLGVVAALLIGVPVTMAAACLGKALEIGIVLRFSPRTRGAIIGLMSWLGYASFVLCAVAVFVIPKVVPMLGPYEKLLTFLPCPWLGLFLGGRSDGSFSFAFGLFNCWVASAVTLIAAVWFSVWGAQQGLAGNFAAADASPSSRRKAGTNFGKEPLYRKEFLWFVRDRSAIVQAILIPLTVASVQVFNLRGLLSRAQGEWNYLCGVAILFGTYFLWVLGPKSLTSEGTALWIALTWPQGLESLLKAKAWLWSVISSGMVVLVLCYAAYLFPSHAWQIALVGVGWFFFGRSMAEKTVTLVTATSASGEREPIPWGRRWAAQLGMLTFSIGVLSQQWHIAVMGIVYSYITAAAMWQNFRARLPYLYDPWSERVPPPPTLMHAMVAISILIEAGSVLTGIVMIFAGRENFAVAAAFSYALCSGIVCIGVWNFLSERGVSGRDVWNWPSARALVTETKSSFGLRDARFAGALAVGAAGGVLLGLLAHGYTTVLMHFPTTAELIRKSQEQMAHVPNLRISYAVIAVMFAPFAEEYLFRGLLYRALDREWGGWHAVIGSAAFFAIYHSPLAWLPVGILGATNAVLFKKTGRLAPCVILHMIYNAVVLAWQ